MRDIDADIKRWSDAINDRDLGAIAALLKENPVLAKHDFVPREKLDFYHMATYSPARYAVMKNDIDLMETFLKGGVEPSFGFAVESVEMAELIIRYGATLDTWDTLQYTPVVMACWFPNAKLMRVLLEAGANPNFPKQNSGATPLMVLAERAEDEEETIEIAKLLVEHGANVNQKAYSGLEDQPVTWDAYNHDVSQGHETALHWAAGHGKVELAKFLIEHGADSSAKTISIHRGGKNEDGSLTFESFDGETPLDWAFKSGDEAMIRLFGGDDALNTVAAAARAGLLKRVEEQLKAGVDVGATDSMTGKTAVALALEHNHIEICRALIAAGAKWPSNLVTAIRKGFPTVVRAALQEDASLKSRLLETPEQLFLTEYQPKEPHLECVRAIMNAEPPMKTDLILAGYLKDSAAARKIVERHTDTIPTCLKTVPALAYYFVCDTDMLKKLLDAGADTEARGIPYDGTPLHKAILYNHSESLKLLLDRGADVEAHFKPVWQPLDMVVCQKWKSDYTMIKPLLDAGADPNVVFHNGYTCLDIVNHRDRDRTDAEYDQAIQWLRAAGAKTSEEL